jgi:hypothetical protein
MPRSGVKQGREAQEIGAAIVAAWYKVLPTAIGVTSVTNAKPAKVTTERAQVQTNDRVAFSEMRGIEELNKGVFVAKNVMGSSFDLWQETSPGTFDQVDTTTFGQFQSGLAAVTVDTHPRLVNLKPELEFVIGKIASKTPNIIYDDPNTVNIVVPDVPDGVYSRQELLQYLDQYHRFGQGHNYHEELGVALLFGCGK